MPASRLPTPYGGVLAIMTTETAKANRRVAIKAGLGGTALSIILFLGLLRLLSWIVEVREVQLSLGMASALSTLAFLAICVLPSICSAAIGFLLSRSQERQRRQRLVLRAAFTPLTLIPIVLTGYVVVSILSSLFLAEG